MSGKQKSGALPSRYTNYYIIYVLHFILNKYFIAFTSACAAVVKHTPVPQRLDMPSFTSPKHLDPTIYPTEVGVSSVSGREGELMMLSTAIKITLDLQKNVKVGLPLTILCISC